MFKKISNIALLFLVFLAVCSVSVAGYLAYTTNIFTLNAAEAEKSNMPTNQALSGDPVNDEFKRGVTTDARKLDFTELELADSSSEQSRGLMFRTELCDTCGMLFVFPFEAPRNFWMKNTYIPLDIVFIASDGTIDTIAKNTKTNQISEQYPSEGSVLYVLEVQAGYSDANNISKGDILNIEHLLDQASPYQLRDDTAAVTI